MVEDIHIFGVKRRCTVERLDRGGKAVQGKIDNALPHPGLGVAWGGGSLLANALGGTRGLGFAVLRDRQEEVRSVQRRLERDRLAESRGSFAVATGLRQCQTEIKVGLSKPWRGARQLFEAGDGLLGVIRAKGVVRLPKLLAFRRRGDEVP